MKKIKVIIFDAYGTLFDVNSAAEKCKEKIGDKWESFANYWRTTQLEYTWLRSLMKRHKDFWQVTEDSLDKSLLAFKIDPNMRSELLNLYKILNTFPEVKEVLKNLKEKKYKISILSNGTPDLLDGLVKSNNLEKMFDDIFSVEEVGIYKPDAKVYDMPIKKYEVAKNEVAFLSANTWDVSGAGNFGFNSIWVNRNKNIFDKLDYIPHNEIKLINLGSSCIYPLDSPNPINEDNLMNGKLEPTNSPYAMAKLTAIEMGDALSQQYGHSIINLMPTNLYGPNDNFSETSSHVIPGLIRRLTIAKHNKDEVFKVWGTGTPKREFLHVDDLSDAIKFLIENNEVPKLINVGSGQEVTIKELVSLLVDITSYKGEVVYDSSMPDGNPRKLLDSSKLNEMGWNSSIDLDTGLENTYKWFMENEFKL